MSQVIYPNNRPLDLLQRLHNDLVDLDLDGDICASLNDEIKAYLDEKAEQSGSAKIKAAEDMLRRSHYPVCDHNINAVLSGRPEEIMTDDEIHDADHDARVERAEQE